VKQKKILAYSVTFVITSAVFNFPKNKDGFSKSRKKARIYMITDICCLHISSAVPGEKFALRQILGARGGSGTTQRRCGLLSL
jgi:hypothetical protein